eukprot:TRINITY_DN734_c0_g1::TRINITY_DN734_c0_g1_i1::g.18406::m.18406 TRINITY_DN734_c0_g1::TRINITY_DN734_c0_g1_i1::g.18406  ORF type:complete len:985 (-),score=111.28,sp/Q96JC1/VPS39_HUMAN/29.94/1e-105,Vps39_2/PF10367.4/2.6e-29,CNH/PF00780.17/5.8e-27,CNH/PF00780.17/5.9e+03,Vps39_1/PF10366.4/2.1e-09,Vps39_1/PF10366.4/3.9e+02,Clathrin/PF00637.15/14,Clathrin/PF00637.15/9.2e-08,Clathrin/PF00637.15/7.5e+03,TPR_11/PF13414.1/0.033,TPR_11/PF13414.1/2.4e+03,TPR_11/PF13414.1/4.1e+02,TPR_19/PF14559.1/0.44,TPR_19/P
MSREAFSTSIILDDLPLSIESLAVWGDDRLVVGTAEGALLVLRIIANATLDGPKYDQLHSKKSFAKKPLMQMHVLETARRKELCGENALLVSLNANDGISIHDLPSFELRYSLKDTRGAHLYCLHTDPVRPTHVELCVAVRKKLLLYSWQTDGDAPELLRELTVPDLPRTMVWCGSSREQYGSDPGIQTVCIGFKREYSLLNVKTGASRDLILAGAVPLAVSLSTGELLCIKDNLGYFYSAYDGQPTRRHAISFTDAPLAITFAHPYVIALLPRMIEVRSVETQYLVQAISIPSLNVFASPTHLQASPINDVFAGSHNQIYRISPIDLFTQVSHLEAAGEFEEALSLCNSIPPSLLPDAERIARTSIIRANYAYHLLAEGQYEKALEHIHVAGWHPIRAIALFPFLHPKTPQLKSALQTALRSIGLSEQDWESSSRPSIPFTSEREVQAKGALVPYLRAARKGWDKEKAGPAASKDRDAKFQQPKALDSWSTAIASLSMVIDTTILKCLLDACPEEVALFLTSQPSIVVEEVTDVLQTRHLSRYLLPLYYARGMHAHALDLLGKIGRKEVLCPLPPSSSGAELFLAKDINLEGDLTGPVPTIMYLKDLARNYYPQDGFAPIKLILESSIWILQAPYIEMAKSANGLPLALEVFTATATVNDKPCIPPREAYDHLRTFAPGLCEAYLEHWVACGSKGWDNPDFHDELALSYLNTILQQQHSQGQGHGNSELMETTRRKLLNFLESSEHYHPEKLLSRFPVDSLYEERAQLLARIGQHQQALGILIHWVGSFPKALEYCNRYYEKSAVDSSDVYLALVKVLLHPDSHPVAPHLQDPSNVAAAKNRPPLFDEALCVLRDYHTRVDVVKALELLPDHIPLSEILPLLEAHLRSFSQVRRNNQVVRNMVKAHSLKVKEEELEARSVGVAVTASTLCQVCQKRIATSVFARYPNGVIVHFKCCTDREVCPVTGERFRVKLPPTQEISEGL